MKTIVMAVNENDLDNSPFSPLWPLKRDEVVTLLLCTRVLVEEPQTFCGTRAMAGWCEFHQQMEFSLGISNVGDTYNADFF